MVVSHRSNQWFTLYNRQMTLPRSRGSFTALAQFDRPQFVDCSSRFRSVLNASRAVEATVEPLARAGLGPITGVYRIPNGAVPL